MLDAEIYWTMRAAGTPADTHDRSMAKGCKWVLGCRNEAPHMISLLCIGSRTKSTAKEKISVAKPRQTATTTGVHLGTQCRRPVQYEAIGQYVLALCRQLESYRLTR